MRCNRRLEGARIRGPIKKRSGEMRQSKSATRQQESEVETYAAKKPLRPKMPADIEGDTYINKNAFAMSGSVHLGRDSEGPSRPGPYSKGCPTGGAAWSDQGV